LSEGTRGEVGLMTSPDGWPSANLGRADRCASNAWTASWLASCSSGSQNQLPRRGWSASDAYVSHAPSAETRRMAWRRVSVK